MDPSEGEEKAPRGPQGTAGPEGAAGPGSLPPAGPLAAGSSPIAKIDYAQCASPGGGPDRT